MSIEMASDHNDRRIANWRGAERIMIKLNGKRYQHCHFVLLVPSVRTGNGLKHVLAVGDVFAFLAALVRLDAAAAPTSAKALTVTASRRRKARVMTVSPFPSSTSGSASASMNSVAARATSPSGA